jgi:hypothetical protein
MNSASNSATISASGRPHARRWLVGVGAPLALIVQLVFGTANAAPLGGASESAAVVSDWNVIALRTLAGDSGKAPQEWGLYLGFIHAAIYDAVVGVKGRYEPYRFPVHAPRHTSATAAAAAAGHRILATYSPYAKSALDASLAATLAGVPDGTAKTNGIAFGERAAQNIIDLRADDGRTARVLFTKPPAPGVWRPTAPAFLPMAIPWLGQVTPLLVRSTTQFAPPPPPALTSRRYAKDFAEVKAYGSAKSTVRTPQETANARFFSGSAALQIEATLRDQVSRRGLDLVDAARVFAAANMALSDAISTTWHAKLFYGVWRPSTAIHLADTDGNAATKADPGWTPLLTNPPYPDYVSGYNTVIGSVTGVLDELFGQPLNLTLISTAVPGEVRHYATGAALRADVVSARVWQGIHFRFADIGGRDVGLRVADWIVDHNFQPVSDQD